ncbi:H-2 class I histocompatibility antigen, alpha chain-like [Tachysurus fulvidraco]|uniref:H-2 class I histocompatibility antigen, alpha chain-like n=1 Tax=Tachysurus fulvidraco TaxID=1234273 RepID=UPI001FEE1848|nr:H-2 class I histocompatibility antigen, alpha chain-like [Tachysurus fulvidraco]
MEDGTYNKVLIFLTYCVHLSLAAFTDTHALQYLYTALTSGINVPEFIAVVLVDEEQSVYYDSNIRKMIPKTEWIQKFSADDPKYWNRETERMQNDQEDYKVDKTTLMHRFNQTTGVHTLQRMCGCELDSGTTGGHNQFGYDGVDFISLDLNTETWTVNNNKAEIFIKEWDPEGEKAKYWTTQLTYECIDQLKKFVSYGRETLERIDPPSVSVIQKHSPLPEVVCHATSFFPKEVNMTWRKDGEDVHEDMELRETLPNQDGSFQKRSILKVPAEELQKHTYTCVIQHSSLEKELVLEVPKGGGSMAFIIGVVVVLSMAFLIFILYSIVMGKLCLQDGRWQICLKIEDNKFGEHITCNI